MIDQREVQEDAQVSEVASMVSLRSITRMASILTGGSGIAQLLNFVGTIAVARLFTPTDFGLYSIFLSAQTLLAVLVTMRYELALVIDTEERNVVFVAALMIWLIFGGCLLLTLVVALMTTVGGGGHLSEGLKPLVWLLPLGLFCAGQYVLATQWCVRIEAFSAIAFAGISVSVVTLAIQISFGVLGIGAVGLVLGFIGGQAAGMLVVWWRIWRRQVLRRILKSAFDWTNLWRVAGFHFRFPAFQMPNSFSSAAYSYFPAVILGAAISPHAAGVFSMGFRLSFQPLSLLPTAFGQVIFSRLSRSVGNMDGWESVLSRSYTLMGVLLAGPVGILMILGPAIAATILGEEWIDAGYVMQILVLPCLLMALAAGYDRIFDVVGQQFLALILSIVSAVVILVVVQFTAAFTVDISAAALAFALVHAVYSLVWTLFAFRSCGFSTRAVVIRWTVIVSIALAVAFFTKLVSFYFSNAVLCSIVVECLYVFAASYAARAKRLF